MKTVQQLLALEENQRIHTRWRVDTIRNVWKMSFIILRQRYHTIQLVCTGDIMIPSKESIIEVSWELVLNPSVKNWWKEVVVSSLTIISKPVEELPIDRSNQETYPWLDHRLNNRHLSLREPKISLAFEIQWYCDFLLRQYLNTQWFNEIHSPKLLWAPSESGAELFALEYFDTTAYLSQSPQFYKQMALCAGMEKVFEVGPAFRAEPSQTSRHNTEFISTDLERSFVSSHHQIMDFEETMILYFIEKINEKYATQIYKYFGINLDYTQQSFYRVTFSEAKELLANEYGLEHIENEDISSQWEKHLAEYLLKTQWASFVFITDYPIAIRPFYHQYDQDQWTTKSFDLLFDGLEITTWALREHRYEILEQQAKEKLSSIESVQFYLNFFKHAVPPHGGLGFGRQRFFTKLFGYENIREMTLVPRDLKRLIP